MRTTALCLLTLVLASYAYPCSITYPREIWSKKPGSQSRLFAFEHDGKVGFIDPAGSVVIGPTIDAVIEDVGDFSDGLARIGHHGYINTSGDWVIRSVQIVNGSDWVSLGDFSEGVALVLQPKAETGTFVDRAGKPVFTVTGNIFGWGPFIGGFATFEAQRKPGIRKSMPGKFEYRDFPGLKGFVDRSGRVAIPAKFAEAGGFSGGLARVVLDGYCHFAHPDGRQDGTPTTGYPTSCGGAPVDAVTPCGTGFIDTAGRFAIEPTFESARDFQEGLAAVRLQNSWGFIDSRGHMSITPRFERAQSFQEGLAAVRVNGKWGFIDRTGTTVIEPQFKRVEPFSNGLALVFKKDRPLYINRTGKTELAGPFLEATAFVHGLAAVRIAEHEIAYIDKRGKVVFRYRRRAEPGGARVDAPPD